MVFPRSYIFQFLTLKSPLTTYTQRFTLCFPNHLPPPNTHTPSLTPPPNRFLILATFLISYSECFAKVNGQEIRELLNIDFRSNSAL